MGTTLTGTTPQDTYDSLIKVTDNGPLSGSLKVLTDGLGNNSTLSLSTAAASIAGTLAVTGAATFSGNVGLANAFSLTGRNAANTINISLISRNASDRVIIDPDGYGTNIGGGGTVLLNPTGGNVGIGTSAPAEKLSVAGAIISTGAITGHGANRVSISQEGANGAFIQSYGTNASTVGAFTFRQASSDFSITQIPLAITTSGVLDISSGIKFPATQVASADANTLDDYEEGTWTGTLRGSVSDPTTAVTATGKYTKIGRVVTAEIQMDAKDTTGASGSVTVTGLPFASSVEAQGAVMSDLYTFGVLCTASNCFVSPFSTTLTFFTTGSNASWAALTHNAGTPRSLRGTVTYFV